MKNWIIRIPEPIPLGDTRFRAIVRAICSAEPVKVFGGGAVETVLTFPDQRLRERFVGIFPLLRKQTRLSIEMQPRRR
jgi:hypothetical protein